MAGIAQVAGETADAAYFSAKAQDYYRRWEEFAIDPSGQHTMLAYQWRSSWGLREFPLPPRLTPFPLLLNCDFFFRLDASS